MTFEASGAISLNNDLEKGACPGEEQKDQPSF